MMKLIYVFIYLEEKEHLELEDQVIRLLKFKNKK